LTVALLNGVGNGMEMEWDVMMDEGVRRTKREGRSSRERERQRYRVSRVVAYLHCVMEYGVGQPLKSNVYPHIEH